MALGWFYQVLCCEGKNGELKCFYLKYSHSPDVYNWSLHLSSNQFYDELIPPNHFALLLQYWYKVLLLAVASGNFPLAQLVECLDTQTEAPRIETLHWKLIYLLHQHCIRHVKSSAVISSLYLVILTCCYKQWFIAI